MPGALSPGIKRPWRKADHSPPASAEVKNSEAIPPFAHNSSWRVTYLLKHGDSFTFTLHYMFRF
jgi:hypothetical protein